MNTKQLETPVAIVDLDRLEANITKLQHYLDDHRIALRPHIKTHKISEIAQMQIEAGAVGITCQKIGEAEVMADAGVRDICIPYNIIGESKLKRLMRLARRVTLSVTADSAFTVRGYAEAAQQENADRHDPLPVLVEFDTGMGRCGVQSPQEAAELARIIAQSLGLRFDGLMTHPNNAQSDHFVNQTRALLKTDGITIERVSYGGTPGMWQVHTRSEVTEYRAGTYVYGDRATMKSGAMSLDDVAFRVITTVVSRPTVERGILDGGSKTFSSDLLGLEGHGLILEYPNAHFYSMSEEHGHVDFSKCSRKPEIGERVTVIPNHCCVVSNLFNQILAVRQAQVETTWDVAARGMLQ
ncbi:MAG: D-TA family PLP-dependent enzyme [Chloroflexi bacterium]|nr:D-TA family PLP-dependent enzyme [Chloroflexota bacterium]